MHKANHYEQLQAEERLEIASLRQQGSSIRAMARILGRSASTLSRELRRNSSVLGYVPAAAHALSSARRSNGSVAVRSAGQSVVICGGLLMKRASRTAGRETAESRPDISSALS